MKYSLEPDFTSGFAFHDSTLVDPAMQEHLRQQSRAKQGTAARLIQRGITQEHLESLFYPSLEHTPVDNSADFDDESFYKVKRIRVNDVMVRYLDDCNAIQVTVEGELAPSLMSQLLEDLRLKLEAIQGSPCEIKQD